MISRSAVLLVAAAVSCGGSQQRSDQIEAGHQAAGVASTPFKGTAELRLLGVAQGAVGSAKLRIKSVEIRANDAVLTSERESDEVELARSDHAWLLAKFEVTEGVQAVEAVVTFESAGSFSMNGVAGDVDATCSVVKIKVLVPMLKDHSHCVLHVDVERSLAGKGKLRRFEPQFSVFY